VLACLVVRVKPSVQEKGLDVGAVLCCSPTVNTQKKNQLRQKGTLLACPDLRDRTKLSDDRKLKQVSTEAHDYKVVLQQLCNKVTVEDAEVISAVLAKVCTL
jgi:hypothetical protein